LGSVNLLEWVIELKGKLYLHLPIQYKEFYKEYRNNQMKRCMGQCMEEEVQSHHALSRVLPFKKLYVLSYHEAPRTQPFLVFMNT
jgi:hypothetical protein